MANYQPIAPAVQLGTLTSAVGLSSRTGSITSSTNANPIVVTATGHGALFGSVTAISAGPPLKLTSAAHGLTSGDRIVLSGVVGPDINNVLSAALGQYTTWQVQVIDSNTFSLYGLKPADVGTAYTSGGTWFRPEVFKIEGHATNTAAVGAWPIAALSSSTFQLLGSTGNGVGGATGTWRTLPIGTRGVLLQALVGNVNWRDDGTDPVAGSGSFTNTLYVGDEPILFEGDLWKFRAINATASSGAVLNQEFVRW